LFLSSEVSNTASFLINWLKIGEISNAEELWPKIWEKQAIVCFFFEEQRKGSEKRSNERGEERERGEAEARKEAREKN
jgi:hypothetical protein